MSARSPSASSPTASAKSERSASSGSTRSSSSSNSNNADGLDGFNEAAVSDRVWARAIHAVTEQKLSLRSVARLYGLHHMALYRRVRARQTALQGHHRVNVDVAAANAAANAMSTAMSTANSTANGKSSSNGYAHMVAAATERFEPPAWLPERPSDLDSVRLSAEQNDECMALLYEEYGPSIIRQRRGDGSMSEEYCFDNDDIREVVRFIVSRGARRDLPAHFPSRRWLVAFKRENGLADGASSYQEDEFHQQFQNSATINGQSDQQPGQTSNWAYPDRPSSSRGQTTSLMRRRQSPRESAGDRDHYYSTSESESNDSSPRQRSSMPTAEQQQQQQEQPSRSDAKTNGDGKMYRQSNTVPAEVWDRAMEDVLIHGMSLRSAAKAHGVHFAALHRRLKKRSLQKESMPFDPRYIPFEDEAGLIRVINSRADLGVLMSYQEVVELLRRATLNHRSELSEEDAAELVRKFRSRVEASIRHLVKDWPLPSVDVLYHQLGPVPTVPSVADSSSMPSASTSSVSPRLPLPPASSLRMNGGGSALSALLSPREWSGNVNGLGRSRPVPGVLTQSPGNGTAGSSPPQSTILRL
jgi:transposase-like protein